ncbi:MAG: corD [Bacteriovoracaceae bacterium]|nr:corD [Bacteriovoracaceae bacterium]
MVSKVTGGILVQVKTLYIPEESNPDGNYFFFAYTVTIQNLCEDPVQLLSRHWVIMDDKGRVEEVRGPGVVGKQPHISPNQSFEYTSFCPLKTQTGSMQGSYEMTRNSKTFHAEIPEFQLIKPGSLGLLH